MYMDKKFNILIVDDEYWERELVKSLLQEQYSRLANVFSADNGKEAIELCKEQSFDVVIMDINMPLIDGLSTIEQIKEVSDTTDFIVLTAFGEFDYAQRTIELGALGYLLKPVEPEQLFAKIDFSIQRKMTNNQREKEIEQLKGTIKNFTPYLKSLFLQNLIFNQFTHSSEVEAFCQGCDMQFIPNRVGVSSITAEQAERIRDLVIPNLELLYFDSKLIMLAKVEDSSSIVPFIEFEKKAGLSLEIGVGSMSESPLHLSRSYREALQAKTYQSVYNKKSILMFEEITKAKGLNNQNGFLESKRLIHMIKSLQKSEALSVLDDIFNLWAGQPIEQVKAYTMELLYLFTMCMYELDYEENKIEETRKEYLLMISHAVDTDEIRRYIKKTLVDLIEAVEQRPRNYQEELINHCKTYIEQHYEEDIDLTWLAEKLHVSPSYLSKIFKKTLGINFVDYLNNVRIERAKFLLSHTNSSIVEISQQVGYSTHKYFSYVFKKYTNNSPTEYRSMYKKEDRIL